MKRTEFIERLRKGLKENQVSDIDDIIFEYEEHFTYKLIDGYSEEEIARKLGTPEILASQFIEGEKSPTTPKSLIYIERVFADLLAGIFFILTSAFGLVVAALSITFGALGIYYLFNLHSLAFMPQLPYWCGALYAICFLGGAVLVACRVIYYVALIRQLGRAYGRTRYNMTSKVTGYPLLPPIGINPQFSPDKKRRLRHVTIATLLIFSIFLVSAYIACSISAGSLEFWHVWGWFIK